MNHRIRGRERCMPLAIALLVLQAACNRAGSGGAADAAPSAEAGGRQVDAEQNPFPEHPGFVKKSINGKSQMIPASELPDEARFFYTHDEHGKKISRVPVLEIEIYAFDKNGLKVPEERASKGIATIYGEGHKYLTSSRLDYDDTRGVRP